MFTSFRIYATSDSCPVRAQEFRCAGIITPWTTRRLRSFFNLTGVFTEAQMFALGGTFEMHISAYRMQWHDKWPRVAANQKVQLSTSRIMSGQTSMALANVHPNNRTTAGGEMNCRECGNELLAEAYSAFIAMSQYRNHIKSTCRKTKKQKSPLPPPRYTIDLTPSQQSALKKVASYLG